MTKFKTVFVTLVLAAGIATAFLLQHRAVEKLRAQNRALASLNEQVAHLRIENERLS